MSFISRISEEETESTNNLNKIEDKEKQTHDKIDNNETITDDAIIEAQRLEENEEFLNQFKHQLYNAVVQGEIEEVETLLELSYADINMTWYSENLLMSALRAKKEQMAEFLIYRGVDVSYEVDLIEFIERNETPIHYKYYSCRQMAYDYDFPNIVALIDFFNDTTNRKIIKYLGRNLFKSNLIRNKEGNLKLLKKEQSKLLDKRLEAFMKSDDRHPSSPFENLKDGSSGLNTESVLYDDIESVKPASLFSMDESMDDLDQEVEEIERKAGDYSKNNSGKKRGKQVSIYEEVEYLSSVHPSVDADGLLELDPKYEIKVTSELNKNITKRLAEKQSNNIISHDKPKRKDFSYKGFKIGFKIDYTDDTGYSSNYTDIVNQKRPLTVIETNSMESIFQQSVSKLNESAYLRAANNDTPITRSKSRTNETPISKLLMNESPVLRKKSLLVAETPIPKLNESPPLQPKSTVNEYKPKIKRKSTINENDLSIRESRISSSRGDIPSLFSSRNMSNSVILNRDTLSSIDLHSITTSSPLKIIRRGTTIRQQKPMIQSSFLTQQNPIKFKLTQKNSLNLNYKDSYLKKLQKSGLSNEYCVPIIRSNNLNSFISAK